MKTSPGGQLPIKDIFGRDQCIAELWRDLETNSIRMEAERRIGKTSILHKMAAEPAEGWEPVSLDLEDVHSAAEFAEKVSEKVQERLEGWKKQGHRLQNFLKAIGGSIGGAGIGPIKFPDLKARPDGYWKKLLTSAIEDLVEQQAAVGKRVVFFFDEMPWMISAIADPDRDGPKTAMEVLDVLRALRQSVSAGHGFRMVLCGSVGMHHVVGTLKDQGYKNQPVNDMKLVEVPPLEPSIARDLATQLLLGEAMKAGPEEARRIAELTGGFPFYIHWVISRLRFKETPGPVTTADIDLAMKKLLLLSAHLGPNILELSITHELWLDSRLHRPQGDVPLNSRPIPQFLRGILLDCPSISKYEIRVSRRFCHQSLERVGVSIVGGKFGTTESSDG